MLAALLVRVPALFGRSWWLDELLTWKVASLRLWETGAPRANRDFAHGILGFTLHDAGPGPLMYLLEGSLHRLAHPMGAEGWLRVPGMLAGLLCVLLCLAGGRRSTGTRFGALCLAAVAASFPGWVDLDMGARGYGWLVLLGLLQWHAMWRLAGPVRKGHQVRGGAITWLLVFVAASCAGLFIHNVHVLWTCSVGAALIYTRVSRKRSSIAKLGAVWIFAAGLCHVVIHAGWMLLWAKGVMSQPAPTSSVGVWQRVAAHITGSWDHQALVLLLLIALVVVGLFAGLRTRVPRAVVVAIGCTVVFGLCLNVVLLARFAIAARYFYALTIPLAWGVARTVGSLPGWSRGKVDRQTVEVCALAALLLLPVKSAMWHAATPEHNWRAAMEFLKPRVTPGDLLVCGPMADMDVLQEYAVAAQLAALPKRLVSAAPGRTVDLFSADGLRTAFSSGRRMWFITANWGAVRPPAYWHLIEQQMDHAATSEGKNPVVIWRSRESSR
jgi:hypothetical protein